MRLARSLRPFLTPRQLTLARCLLRGLPVPRWGNLRRTRPFSDSFGFDRGTPIDRFYLERFLAKHRPAITGTVLEIQLPSYATRFGVGVSRVETVDIESRFHATYTCDLSRAQDVIASDRFDCFLLPNTLCMLRDLEGCLREALRVVRPGGVILATTAALVPLTPDIADYWHLSGAGWREVAARVWPGCDVEVEQYGNCLAAVAAMMGLAAEELSAAELDVHDGRYPVLVGVRCTKAAAA